MANNGFLKKAVFLALLVSISAAGAYAQFAVSGGLAMSRVDVTAEGLGHTYEGEMGWGFNIYLDYLLPINIPLSLGGEIGADSATVGEGEWADTILAVPILLRAAYHFDLFPKLDLYVVGKLGYTFGSMISGPDKDYVDSAGGFAVGFDVGAAYYLTSVLGAFIEVGFDDYAMETKLKNTGTSMTLDTPFYRFVTFGISYKR
jgi:hypothetical protein